MKQIPTLNTDYRHLDLHIGVAERLNAAASSRSFRDIWRWERAILNDDCGDFWEYIQGLAVGDIEGQQVNTVLRLVCLFSLANGGIKASIYDAVVFYSYLIACFMFLPDDEDDHHVLRAGISPKHQNSRKCWYDTMR